VAADRLLDSSWHGVWSQELHGPTELTFDEAAVALSEGLHRKLTHVKVSPQKARQAMLANGLSENAADLMLEMYDAVETGRLHCRGVAIKLRSVPVPISRLRVPASPIGSRDGGTRIYPSFGAGARVPRLRCHGFLSASLQTGMQNEGLDRGRVWSSVFDQQHLVRSDVGVAPRDEAGRLYGGL
jgi:hypothetical protein